MGNPYNFTRPVADPNLFFGRKAIRQEILDGVRSGASFAIVGGTRIGKTSLLFQIRRALLEQLQGPHDAVIGPVFLSTHELPPLSQRIIYRRIIEDYRTTVGMSAADTGWRDGMRLFDRTLEENDAFDAFRQALDTIFGSPNVVRRIVIMIDEVDELRRYEWSHSFFNNLRHLISQTEHDRIGIVIAGTLAIRSLYNVAGSPFLNVIQGTKRLELLSRGETEELVGRPTAHKLDASVGARVYFETGGHPFLAQYIMKYLWDRFPDALEKATETDVASIVERFFQERNDFGDWVRDFSDAEKQAYLQIAASPQGTTRAELVASIGDPKQVDDAILTLTHFGVTREDRPGSNRYLVGGDMFRRWFAETFGAAPTPRRTPPAEPVRSPAVPEVRLLKVFVASPGDVADERKALFPVVEEINRTVAAPMRCMLQLVTWENDVYPDVSAGGPQAVVDSQVDVAESDVVIGIFSRRLGTPTPFSESGSVHEIQRAAEASVKGRKPRVMVYFKEQSTRDWSIADFDEYRKVLAFREKLQTVALCETYRDVPQFSELARKHLGAFLRKYAADSRSVAETGR